MVRRQRADRWRGPVADVGCGPGEVTAHLHELGVDAFGIDLSPAMIDVARRDHPGLRFEVGSMTELNLPVASVVDPGAGMESRRHPQRARNTPCTSGPAGHGG
ncbi:class I SAM-dependent methyltransferase [Nocardia brasiliensis]